MMSVNEKQNESAVVDAQNNVQYANVMEVEVTETDIFYGERFSIHECPIAKALKRMFLTDKVEVTEDHIEVNGRIYGTNKRIIRFIDNFDYRKPVKPFRFKLEEVK